MNNQNIDELFEYMFIDYWSIIGVLVRKLPTMTIREELKVDIDWDE